MKTIFYYILIILITFFSCKRYKEEVITPLLIQSEYMPLKKGNYWVYQYYHTNDDNEVVYETRTDSMYISKDTLINNQRFFKIEKVSQYEEFLYPRFICDSSAYLLSGPGSFILCPDTTKVVAYEGQIYYLKSRTCRKDSLVNTPSHTFTNTITYKTYCEGKPGNESGNQYWVFEKNVGIIQREVFFSNMPDKPLGIKLIRYHLN